jgi:hypothetical protein
LESLSDSNLPHNKRFVVVGVDDAPRDEETTVMVTELLKSINKQAENAGIKPSDHVSPFDDDVDVNVDVVEETIE